MIGLSCAVHPDLCRWASVMFVLVGKQDIKATYCNPSKQWTDQQSVGAMDGDAAGEGVVDGHVTDIGWRAVPSSLIHISIHVEMNGVVTHSLLAHVLELHPGYMNRPEPPLHLDRIEEMTRITPPHTDHLGQV